MEKWKDIPGFEGLYQASNTGLIRSAPGKITSNKRFGQRCWKTRVLKFKYKSRRRDAAVTLWKDGMCKDYLVSRLVAMTWCKGYATHLTVNHIDGNPQNNDCSNLEWVSLGDNIKKGFEFGLYANNQHPVILVCDEITSSEITLYFPSMAGASRFLGRHNGYISDCLSLNKPITAADGKQYIIKDVICDGGEQ